MADPGLLLFCILSALAATGYSIPCVTCVNFNNTLCSGPSVICTSNNSVCTSTLTVTSSSSDPSQYSEALVRGCGVQSACDKTGSVSILNTAYRVSVTCCSTNNCSPPMPVLPPDNNRKKNGVTCMTCMDNKYKECFSNDLLECHGNENKCYSQSATMNNGSYQLSASWSGCATKEACEGNYNLIPGIYISSTKGVSCKDGCSGLCYNLLLLLILSALSLYFI